MPRKKKTIVEETIPDAVEDRGEDMSDIICVLTKVYKLNSGGKSFCFQTTEPVDEVSIQAQYPTGGKFIVQEYNSINDVIRTQHIDIEPRPLTNDPSLNNGDIRIQLLMQELSHSRNMMMEMIRGMFNSTNKPASTPLGELAQAMQVVHEMKSGSNPVDLIIKGMELGAKANGSTDWKAELVNAAKDTLPAIANAMSATRQIQQGQTPMIQTTPAAMIKQGIDWLKPKILSGMDTGLAIGWVVQNSNDPLCQQLLAHAIQGDINTFIQIDPEIGNEPYRTWFTSAIQQLKEWYAAQNANQNNIDGGIGDDSDVADDEVISSGKSKIVKAS